MQNGNFKVMAKVREQLATGSTKGLAELLAGQEEYVRSYAGAHLKALGLCIVNHRGKLQLRDTEEYHRHRLESIEQVQEFLFGGNASFTLRNPDTKNRFTFKVKRPRKKQADGKFKVQDRYEVFVARMVDRRMVYDQIAKIEGVWGQDLLHMVRVKDRRRSALYKQGGDPQNADMAWKAFEWLYGLAVEGKPLSPPVEFWHEGRCGKCGRKLTDPQSIADGIGPVCVKHKQDEKGVTHAA